MNPLFIAGLVGLGIAAIKKRATVSPKIQRKSSIPKMSPVRKNITNDFKKVSQHDNQARANLAKKLVSTAKTSDEKIKAQKLVGKETQLVNIKNKINASSDNKEKLRLAMQAKNIASPQQKIEWEKKVRQLELQKNKEIPQRKKVQDVIPESTETKTINTKDNEDDMDSEETSKSSDIDIDSEKDTSDGESPSSSDSDTGDDFDFGDDSAVDGGLDNESTKSELGLKNNDIEKIDQIGDFEIIKGDS